MRDYDRQYPRPERDLFGHRAVRERYDTGYREGWGMEGLARRFWGRGGYDEPFRHRAPEALGGGAFWRERRPSRARRPAPPRRRMRYEDTFFARAYDRFRF